MKLFVTLGTEAISSCPDAVFSTTRCTTNMTVKQSLTVGAARLASTAVAVARGVSTVLVRALLERHCVVEL